MKETAAPADDASFCEIACLLRKFEQQPDDNNFRQLERILPVFTGSFKQATDFADYPRTGFKASCWQAFLESTSSDLKIAENVLEKLLKDFLRVGLSRRRVEALAVTLKKDNHSNDQLFSDQEYQKFISFVLSEQIHHLAGLTTWLRICVKHPDMISLEPHLMSHKFFDQLIKSYQNLAKKTAADLPSLNQSGMSSTSAPKAANNFADHCVSKQAIILEAIFLLGYFSDCKLSPQRLHKISKELLLPGDYGKKHNLQSHFSDHGHYVLKWLSHLFTMLVLKGMSFGGVVMKLLQGRFAEIGERAKQNLQRDNLEKTYGPICERLGRHSKECQSEICARCEESKAIEPETKAERDAWCELYEEWKMTSTFDQQDHPVFLLWTARSMSMGTSTEDLPPMKKNAIDELCEAVRGCPFDWVNADAADPNAILYQDLAQNLMLLIMSTFETRHTNQAWQELFCRIFNSNRKYAAGEFLDIWTMLVKNDDDDPKVKADLLTLAIQTSDFEMLSAFFRASDESQDPGAVQAAIQKAFSTIPNDLHHRPADLSVLLLEALHYILAITHPSDSWKKKTTESDSWRKRATVIEFVYSIMASNPDNMHLFDNFLTRAQHDEKANTITVMLLRFFIFISDECVQQPAPKQLSQSRLDERSFATPGPHRSFRNDPRTPLRSSLSSLRVVHGFSPGGLSVDPSIATLDFTCYQQTDTTQTCSDQPGWYIDEEDSLMLRVLEATVSCLLLVAENHIDSFMSQLRVVFPDERTAGQRLGRLVKACQTVLEKVEVPQGKFSVSIGWMNIMKLMVPRAYRHDYDLSSMVHHARERIFADYNSWRYQTRIDRWKLGAAVSGMLHEVLLLPPPSAVFDDPEQRAKRPLKDLRLTLFNSFISEDRMHKPLIKPLMTGARVTSRLVLSQRKHERESLEAVVTICLQIMKILLSGQKVESERRCRNPGAGGTSRPDEKRAQSSKSGQERPAITVVRNRYLDLPSFQHTLLTNVSEGHAIDHKLVPAIAFYASYLQSLPRGDLLLMSVVQLQCHALDVITQMCPPGPSGAVNLSAAADTLRSAFEDGLEEGELQPKLLELLVAVSLHQPALAEWLISRGSWDDSKTLLQEGGSSGQGTDIAVAELLDSKKAKEVSLLQDMLNSFSIGDLIQKGLSGSPPLPHVCYIAYRLLSSKGHSIAHLLIKDPSLDIVNNLLDFLNSESDSFNEELNFLNPESDAALPDLDKYNETVEYCQSELLVRAWVMHILLEAVNILPESEKEALKAKLFQNVAQLRTWMKWCTQCCERHAWQSAVVNKAKKLLPEGELNLTIFLRTSEKLEQAGLMWESDVSPLMWYDEEKLERYLENVHLSAKRQSDSVRAAEEKEFKHFMSLVKKANMNSRLAYCQRYLLLCWKDFVQTSIVKGVAGGYIPDAAPWMYIDCLVKRLEADTSPGRLRTFARQELAGLLLSVIAHCVGGADDSRETQAFINAIKDSQGKAKSSDIVINTLTQTIGAMVKCCNDALGKLAGPKDRRPHSHGSLHLGAGSTSVSIAGESPLSVIALQLQSLLAGALMLFRFVVRLQAQMETTAALINQSTAVALATPKKSLVPNSVWRVAETMIPLAVNCLRDSTLTDISIVVLMTSLETIMHCDDISAAAAASASSLPVLMSLLESRQTLPTTAARILNFFTSLALTPTGATLLRPYNIFLYLASNLNITNATATSAAPVDDQVPRDSPSKRSRGGRDQEILISHSHLDEPAKISSHPIQKNPAQLEEARQWHEVWCAGLGLICALLRSSTQERQRERECMHYEEHEQDVDFVQKVLQFLKSFHQRLEAATHSGEITGAKLKEVEKVIALLYEVEKADSRWRYNRFTNRTAQEHVRNVTYLMHHYSKLLEETEELKKCARFEEKKESKSTFEQDSIEAVVDRSGPQFADNAQQLALAQTQFALCRCVRHMLGFLFLVTKHDHDSGERREPVFTSKLKDAMTGATGMDYNEVVTNFFRTQQQAMWQEPSRGPAQAQERGAGYKQDGISFDGLHGSISDTRKASTLVSHPSPPTACPRLPLSVLLGVFNYCRKIQKNRIKCVTDALKQKSAVSQRWVDRYRSSLSSFTGVDQVLTSSLELAMMLLIRLLELFISRELSNGMPIVPAVATGLFGSAPAANYPPAYEMLKEFKEEIHGILSKLKEVMKELRDHDKQIGQESEPGKLRFLERVCEWFRSMLEEVEMRLIRYDEDNRQRAAFGIDANLFGPKAGVFLI